MNIFIQIKRSQNIQCNRFQSKQDKEIFKIFQLGHLFIQPNDPEAQKNFTFDGSYGIDSDTSQIYDNIAYDLIDGVIEGYNGTIFAYGQTGCGKSFTMQVRNLTAV